MSQYCVYLTIYSGNRLPPFYIGSSSVDNVIAGYHGSVRSRKYGKQWAHELKHNPHLFKTAIIQKFPLRKEALAKEYLLQVQLNVVRSSMYINQAIASPDGCHGMDVSGENNPMFNKHHSSEAKVLQSRAKKGKAKSEESKIRSAKIMHDFWNSNSPKVEIRREKCRQAHLGEKAFCFGKFGKDNHNYGRKASESEKVKKSLALTGKKKSAEHVRKFSKVYKIERELDGATFIGYGLSDFGRVIRAGAALLIYHFNNKKGFSNGYRIVENLGVSDDPATPKLSDFLK